MMREHPMESQGPLKVGEEVRGLCYEDEKAWTRAARCEEGGRGQEPGVVRSLWKLEGSRKQISRESPN